MLITWGGKGATEPLKTDACLLQLSAKLTVNKNCELSITEFRLENVKAISEHKGNATSNDCIPLGL